MASGLSRWRPASRLGKAVRLGGGMRAVGPSRGRPRRSAVCRTLAIIVGLAVLLGGGTTLLGALPPARAATVPAEETSAEQVEQAGPTDTTAEAAAPAGQAEGAAPAGDPSLVTIRSGTLRGVITENGRVFAGIPYAAPPVGERRWRLPEPPPSWEGVRDATWSGPACPQSASRYNANPSSENEDCLYLNVFTPPVDTAPAGPGKPAGAGKPAVPGKPGKPGKPGRPAKLPVMVWIHGGGNSMGSGGSYNASLLARTGDVIVVVFNYRLGALGFLAHPALSGQEPDGVSGNYGLADQQAALRWVRDNIAAFGGDPRNVTIFGESAGGEAVCAHLASPTAAGLFHRAIAQSGCLLSAQDRAAAEQHGMTLAAELGCPSTPAPSAPPGPPDDAQAATAACLRALPVADILAASPDQLQLAAGTGWGPVPGGKILPRPTRDAFAVGAVNRVPFIQGTNHDEATLFIAIELDPGDDITAEEYSGALRIRFEENAAAVEAEYPAGDYPSPTLALAAVLTDSIFACPARATTRQLARRMPTYLYEFNDPDAPPFVPADFPLGAYHAAELQYVFGVLPVLGVRPEFTPQQAELSDRMIRYWTAFAHRGVPLAWGAPVWLPSLLGKVQNLAPGAVGPMRDADFAADHHCAFWDSLPTG